MDPANLPILLGLAWLLPLASFVLIVFFGQRMGKHAGRRFFVAADVHSLVQRSNDPVRLFNAGSLWEHYSVAPGGKSSLLQLVGFTGRPSGSVSVAPSRAWASATLHTLGSGPTVLRPVIVDGRPEFHLPVFSTYAALEFKS